MNIIKPDKLKKGDTIGIVSLSGPVKTKKSVLNAKKYFENKGYKVILSDYVFAHDKYLAGNDEDKISELHKFFSDKNINAILCARGGYGAIRIINKIDYDLIKKNPKIFAGFSDITAFEAMIYKKTGLVTFYAPMASGDFGCEKISKITEKSFFKTLTAENELEFLPDLRKAKIYSKGEAKGIFWGGNLATIQSLCGLDFIPDEKFIFFAEDLGEPVYKVDKMFRQLLNIEKFKENLGGIILGDFLDVEDKYKYQLDELFVNIGKETKVPILSGFRITHAHDKITVPYGAMTSFSTNDKKLKFESFLID